MSKLMLDVSQAEELKLAFRRNGWNNAQIKTLSEGDLLAKVLKVITGQAEITYPEHSIDCNIAPSTPHPEHFINSDATPFIPDGWILDEHYQGGLFRYSQSEVSLYMPNKQKKGGMEGNKLRRILQDNFILTLNANVLDYLMAHQELIPENWKGNDVFFWDTTYRQSAILKIRYMYWSNNKWHSDGRSVNSYFNFKSPAAIKLIF